MWTPGSYFSFLVGIGKQKNVLYAGSLNIEMFLGFLKYVYSDDSLEEYFLPGSPGTTVTGEQCVPFKYDGKIQTGCYDDGDGFPWCATTVDDNMEYITKEFCGHGNKNGNDCVWPQVVSDQTWYECYGRAWDNTCSTSTYGSKYNYTTRYSKRYCTEEETWRTFIVDDLGVRSCGEDGCTTVTGEMCVDFVHEGKSYHNQCTEELYSWCATSTNSDGTYADWAYCGFGNSNANDCQYPFNNTEKIDTGFMFWGCTQNSVNGWCATSTYANTKEPYTQRMCNEWDWFDHIIANSTFDIWHHDFGNERNSTVDGKPCLDYKLNNKWYNGTCHVDSRYNNAEICATSTWDDHTMHEHGICGYGNGDSDECIFPFVYNQAEYWTCAQVNTTGYTAWCATAINGVTREWTSRKNCNETSLALGMNVVNFPSTGLSRETQSKCLPSIKNGAYFTECYDQHEMRSMCAVEVDEYGNMERQEECGYGQSVGSNGDIPCVFPFKWSDNDQIYTTCTEEGKCAISVYSWIYTQSNYKECNERELALGKSHICFIG